MRHPGDPGGDSAEREFERLRRPFAAELERWPDFVTPSADRLHDVVPLADLEETDAAYVVDVELPGVRREDIDLEVQRARLVVTAARRLRRRTGLLLHGSRTRGGFALAVVLPVPVDTDGVTATFDDGVLSVVVPKAERARPRRIPLRPPG